MPASTPINSSSSMRTNAAPQGKLEGSDVQNLLQFATRGLSAMFDKNSQIFCHRLLSTSQGLVSEGLSHRYTAMTLLGLKRVELTGGDSSFDIRGIYQAFVRDTRWIQGAGDAGLLIWLVAAFDPGYLEEALRKLHCETALDRFSDARERHTMELAWFLSGLSHAATAQPSLAGTLTDTAVKTYRLLTTNRGQHGYFGHKGTKNSFSGFIRGHIGSFADQVYPIYALSKFAKAFHLEEPLAPALECARAICHAQGKLGQWWWLYDSRSARVSSQYPVYSVHQHGMAPMCLFAVEEATGQSFREPLYKGLRWIYGENELGVDMRNTANTLIWRCILPTDRKAKFLDIALSAIRKTNHDQKKHSLEVLYEQRPYEYGWLLYAFARRAESETFV